MSLLDAVATVLGSEGAPLRIETITERVLSQGLWTSTGKTPQATIEARLAVEVSRNGDGSRFVRPAPRTYGLRSWPTQQIAIPAPKPTHMSFTEAAEAVLSRSTDHAPMSYKAITAIALTDGLLTTSGLTPPATMYASLISDIDRRTKRGDQQRFTRFPEGLFGLAKWSEGDLESRIAKHNREVRSELLGRLMTMEPKAFEALVGELLVELGFGDVVVTKYHGDGGIDVRGILVVGDVVQTRMAVQVKRWKANVRAPEVQKVRGSLGAHEVGLIITTSDFADGARTEAGRPDATPVALMNGDQLVGLLIEHQIGVVRKERHLLQLSVASEQTGDE